jgi:tRNA(Ile)-lysidine synthase
VKNWVAEIDEKIRRKDLIRRGERILVAVSGGVDSMALLHVLHELAKIHRWKIFAAHFNHKLRGRSSDADENLVRKTAAQLRLKFFSEHADVKQFSERNGISIEMAARKLRHEFLARTAKRLKIKTIALAHHADDQVELFFLRLFRGAGAEGLAGMKWKSSSPADTSLQLVRPMLDQSKDDLLRYAKTAGISFRDDASNESLDFQRNRIRHELVPLLTKNFQPALQQTILRAMEIIGAESDFVSASTSNWLKNKKTPFSKLPVAIQRQSLRQQLLAKGISADFELVESLRTACGKWFNVNRGISVSRDLRGVVSNKKLEVPRFADERSVRTELTSGRAKFFFDGMEIECSIQQERGMKFRAVRNCEYFDARKTGRVIVLRHWKSGDRFQPIGMSEPVKLQNLFTNLKVSRAERHRRIVATTEYDEIFWVEGLRMSERFKLDNQSVQRLKWKWRRRE